MGNASFYPVGVFSSNLALFLYVSDNGFPSLLLFVTVESIQLANDAMFQ